MAPIGPNGTATRRAPRVVVIALDGTDPDSIARCADAGWLPELSKAVQRARRVDLKSLGDLFVPAPWPCALSGVAVENHGIHAFRPIKSGTLNMVEGTQRHVPAPFWETAVQAGLRAEVLDAPICAPPPRDAALHGLRFVEWGAHPPVRAPGSFPRRAISEVIDRHGLHPCRADDPAAATADELTSIQARLCEGVRIRERVIMDMLDGNAPDLIVAGVSEAHIAEHQFLNLTVPGHPRYDSEVAAALGDGPLRSVYQAVDTAIGEILRRLPAETTVLLVCLGGVRVIHGGWLFLDDVLRQAGLTGSQTVRPSVARRLWRLLPERIRQAGRNQVPKLVRRSGDGLFWASFDWAATRAFALPWTMDGYLRVNLRGREPHGIVEPGAERTALLDEIETLLGELKIAGTDKPAVRRIVRAQDTFAGRASAELPDLMVLWDNGAPIEAIESPRLGRIRNRDIGPRGSHTDRGSIFAWGPGIAEGPPISGARDIDVAPTVLALLGIAPPEAMDGRVIGDLLRSTEAGRATQPAVQVVAPRR
jgi:predicted AlkP superfamily phosphohydrolase/phosphomutase